MYSRSYLLELDHEVPIYLHDKVEQICVVQLSIHIQFWTTPSTINTKKCWSWGLGISEMHGVVFS